MLLDTNVIVIYDNIILILTNVFVFIYLKNLYFNSNCFELNLLRISNTIFTILCSMKEHADSAHPQRVTQSVELQSKPVQI